MRDVGGEAVAVDIVVLCDVAAAAAAAAIDVAVVIAVAWDMKDCWGSGS